MARYDWKKSMSETDKDISEYLEKRYDDYCRDIGECREDGKDWYKIQDRKKHWDKQDRLVEFGFEIKDKLRVYPRTTRETLFEEMVSTHERLDKFYLVKYDDFCMELEEIDNSYDLKQLKKKKKHEELLRKKELMGQALFIEKADELMVNLKKYVKEKKKKEAEEEIKRKKETEEEEKRKMLDERRQGHSNVKPLSFYEEAFDEETIDEEQELDAYFQEFGKPKGVWRKYKNNNPFGTKEYWQGDFAFSDRETNKYILVDNPVENQKLLNRCKEMVDIVVNLKDSEHLDDYFPQMELYQKYLTEGYLITRQIAWNIEFITQILIRELSKNPNKSGQIFKDHPSREYDFSIYNNNFNITQIKEDVAEFVRIKEGIILTPIEWLKVYLKKHDNMITIKDYELIINKTNKVAKRILKGFVADKELKSKKVGSSHMLVFYV